ncbi:methyltransferase family protein [Pseudidiomarina andamanensis]|uniref:Isoprenylcysteine carboxylmethyltransferase family protein n=1 Tax=Pseudidiomarina andamanensis TaxID=1940690 RepID=A0AA92IMK4_9GAMM|nr:isoprenylcysteine carboxylmethyltransferase family protein [Pseudidiomarina andamanensis]MDS0218842.1 isoprenylcysteine carboxylmethyltransferase family protein [Pseudidiomarina andamanensis]QGT96209.1 isoprenylcysteine carboxylmethyltransferase family protein [Pseudidiomarina andamanensis]
MRTLELKIPPVVVVLVIAGLMAFTAKLIPMEPWHFTDAKALAFALVTAGSFIAVAGVVAFRQAKTTANPMNPNASSALVASGIYRFTRNPMYLGFLLALAGWGVWLASLPALLWLVVYILFINRYQIIPEERILEEKFGDEFIFYRKKVRRWF